jgi:hypothetical protein
MACMPPSSSPTQPQRRQALRVAASAVAATVPLSARSQQVAHAADGPAEVVGQAQWAIKIADGADFSLFMWY